MPTFRDFSENRKLLDVRSEPLSANNFPRYLAQYGPERAAGYRDALTDLVSQISQILDTSHGNGFLPNTPSTVRTELRKLYYSQQILLDNLTTPTSLSDVIPPSESNNDTSLTP